MTVVPRETIKGRHTMRMCVSRDKNLESRVTRNWRCELTADLADRERESLHCVVEHVCVTYTSYCIRAVSSPSSSIVRAGIYPQASCPTYSSQTSRQTSRSGTDISLVLVHVPGGRYQSTHAFQTKVGNTHVSIAHCCIR